MKIPRWIISSFAVAALAGQALAADNAVLYWNQQALDATRLSRNPPPLAAVLFAAYHAAIFDAVNGIEHKYHGWLVDERAPAGIDADAAIASAAHAVQVKVWSDSSNPRNLQRAYDQALAAIAEGPAKTAGIAWGEQVAEQVLGWLAKSNYNKPVPGQYSSNDAGKWRETPSAFRPALLPFWGRVTPFVMTSQAQFRVQKRSSNQCILMTATL